MKLTIDLKNSGVLIGDPMMFKLKKQESKIVKITNDIITMIPESWEEYYIPNKIKSFGLVKNISAKSLVYELLINTKFINDSMYDSIKSIVDNRIQNYVISGGNYIFNEGDFDIMMVLIVGILRTSPENELYIQSNKYIINSINKVNQLTGMSSDIYEYFQSLSMKYINKNELEILYSNYTSEPTEDPEESSDFCEEC